MERNFTKDSEKPVWKNWDIRLTSQRTSGKEEALDPH
jgi:hypothetical protein